MRVTTITADDFQRTFISELLDNGADIASVAKLARHSNVTTTARDDRRGDRAAELAAGFLSVPYVGL